MAGRNDRYGQWQIGIGLELPPGEDQPPGRPADQRRSQGRQPLRQLRRMRALAKGTECIGRTWLSFGHRGAYGQSVVSSQTTCYIGNSATIRAGIVFATA